jgi:methylase of polypeptide subunit release factors
LKINYPDNEEFFALPFYVDSRVLVPRNDTETMIYQVLKEITPTQFPSIECGAKQCELTIIDV